MSPPEWLPPLFHFKGNWALYLNALYELFKADFIDMKPQFRGRRLGLKRHPMSEGKEAAFWHLIQEGPVEELRLPDLKRCERIRWPRPIIENSEDSTLKVWMNIRKGEARVLLFLEEEEYLGSAPYLRLSTGDERGRPEGGAGAPGALRSKDDHALRPPLPGPPPGGCGRA